MTNGLVPAPISALLAGWLVEIGFPPGPFGLFRPIGGVAATPSRKTPAAVQVSARFPGRGTRPTAPGPDALLTVYA